MTATLLFVRAHWRAILLLLLVIVLAVEAISAIRDYGQQQYQAGRNAVIAEDADASAQAGRAADQHAAAAAAAGVALHTKLDIALPRIEATTHAATEKVRTIYLAQPADSRACVRPAGVQAELDAALRAANAAADHQL
jgi:hypothetical protein